MKNPFSILNMVPKSYFDMIPQTGVTHKLVEEEPEHNAIWDMAVSPEGRIFFSVCGENYSALYARLYEYEHKTKTFRRHLALEEKILQDEDGLRTSKFHTAISFVGDHWILTTTHTTSPGPHQPRWMPYEYADHPYEGYPGSSLLLYNYETGETKGLGVFTPHDTTYGGVYDPKHGDYYSITWMRGVGYVYNLHTGERRCLGQVSDPQTSRVFPCSDGHIYGCTFSGAMFRYNTDLRDIEYLGVSAPEMMRHAAEWDGKLYFTTGPCGVAGRGQMLYSYDFETRKITEVGRPVPKIGYNGTLKDVFYNAYGMAFDSKGRMWYGCMTFIHGMRYAGARLYMWDFLHGGEPMDCGFLGSPLRTISITGEMRIIDDVLYISDGNHTSDRDTPCGIMAIDLDQFVPALTDGTPRLASHDYINYLPFPDECRAFYPKDDFEECLERYMDYDRRVVKHFEEFSKENAYYYPAPESYGVCVWETIGRENTYVHHITWTDEHHFEYICGSAKYFKVRCTVLEHGVHVEEIEEVKQDSSAAALDLSELHASIPSGVRLPAVPGRRFLAEAESSVALPDGSILVGTKDTLLARIKKDSVQSLGMVCTAGGIHSMTVLPDGTVLGVAGHRLGVGTVFTYREETGVIMQGLVPQTSAENGRVCAIFRPVTIASSPNGTYAAIGGADELSGVTVMKLK